MKAKIYLTLGNGLTMVKNNYYFLIGPFPQLRITVPAILEPILEPIIIIIDEVHIMREQQGEHLVCYAKIDPRTLIHGWFMRTKYLLKGNWHFLHEEDRKIYEDSLKVDGEPLVRASSETWIGET